MVKLLKALEMSHWGASETPSITLPLSELCAGKRCHRTVTSLLDRLQFQQGISTASASVEDSSFDF